MLSLKPLVVSGPSISMPCARASALVARRGASLHSSNLLCCWLLTAGCRVQHHLGCQQAQQPTRYLAS
jgi:hypothetical protein